MSSGQQDGIVLGFVVNHNTPLPPLPYVFHKSIILKGVKAFVLIDFCKSIVPKDL